MRKVLYTEAAAVAREVREGKLDDPAAREITLLSRAGCAPELLSREESEEMFGRLSRAAAWFRLIAGMGGGESIPEEIRIGAMQDMHVLLQMPMPADRRKTKTA